MSSEYKKIVTESMVLAKCQYFVDVQLWPPTRIINPHGWLTNFKEEEKIYALHILNNFIYLSNLVTNQLLETAFHQLSNHVRDNASTLMSAKREWVSFINSAYITHATGEIPNTSDSGHTFARKIRNLIGFDEEKIVPPKTALELAVDGIARNIIFVDDFIGTGNQLHDTWHRKYLIKNFPTSFNDIATLKRNVFFYSTPVICTAKGYKHIHDKCPQIRIFPAHLLTEHYSVFNKSSLFWNDDSFDAGINCIETASKRAGIPDCNKAVGDWRGFHGLGLAIAFEHHIPDATLPIFSWDRNGWTPLIDNRALT